MRIMFTPFKTYRGFPRLYLYHPDHGRVQQVYFTKPFNNDTELPSRVLLETHAAIARIYHASGAVESIEEILRDREELCQLAEDESTNIADILSVLIAV